MKSTILLLLFFLSIQTNAQVNVGAWRDHLPYQSCRKVVKIGTKVYCSTENNIFTYDTKDNSLQKLSKITGLSDIGIANMEYNADKNILFVAYSDGNIDLIKDQTITNIPDIYKQTIPGSKKANHIFFRQNFAYVSYSFGIVVIDLDKIEIKDTYQVGEAGATYEVLSTVADDKYFYAATAKGIFKADINDPFLVNYLRWQRDNTIPNSTGKFNTLGVFNGNIVANFNGSADKTDTLYYHDNTGWKKFLETDHLNHYEIRSVGNQLLVTGLFHVYFINTSFQVTNSISDYGFTYANPNSAWLDAQNNVWIADGGNGLILKANNSGSFQSIYPNGPTSKNVGEIRYVNGSIYATGGGTTTGMAPLYFRGEYFQFKEESWKSFSNQSAFDYTVIAPNPKDDQRIYTGSWGGGVYVYQNGQVVDQYTDKNSPLRTSNPGTSLFCIGGMIFDGDQNLWIAQGGVHAPISILKPSGTWSSLAWGGVLNAFALGKIHIDQFNQFWVPLPPNHGVFVFDYNKTIDNEKDDKTIRFNPVSAYGEVIQGVFCVTSDRNGTVWIGTDHGPLYYSSPQDVFNGQTAGTPVLIPRNDGKNTVDPLLGTESVNCITVDGANRKWIGTINGGAFLVSPDGTKQVYHFNKDNSPILSNNVLSIAIDDRTGEVFFGTDRGIISFRANATQPNDDFTNVYVYPNPVRPEYDGIITITGLVENAIVKITDVSGNLVYQTKSLGGQAIWDGKGHGGRRVATGVYIVFCSSEDGSKTYVTKMLVIH